MALFSDTVPKWVYDELKADRDALLEKYHALRLAGANAPVPLKPGRVVPPGPSDEARAAQRMHSDVIDRIAEEIETIPGVSKAVAQAEAKRLKEAAFGVDGLP